MMKTDSNYASSVCGSFDGVEGVDFIIHTGMMTMDTVERRVVDSGVPVTSN